MVSILLWRNLLADTTMMPIFAIPSNAVSCPLFPVSILSLQLTFPVVACLLDVHEQASPVLVNSHRIRTQQPQFDRFQAKNLF